MPTKEEENCLSFNKFYYNYARFHDHPINKLIHIVWIPIITFTVGVFAAQLWSAIPMVTALTFTVIYGMIRIRTGILWFIMSVPGAYLCTLVAANKHLYFAGYSVQQICVIMHILGWISQLVGHGVFESK